MSKPGDQRLTVQKLCEEKKDIGRYYSWSWQVFSFVVTNAEKRYGKLYEPRNACDITLQIQDHHLQSTCLEEAKKSSGCAGGIENYKGGKCIHQVKFLFPGLFRKGG